MYYFYFKIKHMKQLFFILFGLFFCATITAQEFKFEEETIDYGKIEKGTNGKRTFVFTNVGDAPITIQQVKSSCGCTIPKKPKKPIMPGDKGEIEVSYDTNRLGGFSKTITIYSNAKNKQKAIKIKGFVDKGISLEKEKNTILEN